MNRFFAQRFIRIALAALFFQLGIVTVPVRGMNMPSYDDVSLTYMSTDIVIADLSESPQYTFTITVTDVLYGVEHLAAGKKQFSSLMAAASNRPRLKVNNIQKAFDRRMAAACATVRS
jgi:hypothetical protein